ncbi:RasGEF [Acrasis kona]|uniref:RasGEF n=1 Tax=Acrasis kona TaxID=1008807 RepID=A0AAW2YMR0_9EUKA
MSEGVDDLVNTDSSPNTSPVLINESSRVESTQAESNTTQPSVWKTRELRSDKMVDDSDQLGNSKHYENDYDFDEDAHAEDIMIIPELSVTDNLRKEKSQSTSQSINENEERLEPFAKECLHLFNGEWTVMNRGSEDFVAAKEADYKHIFVEPNKEFEVHTKRSTCHPQSFLSNHFNIFVKCHSLRLEVGCVEPLYCSLELVDIAKQINVSERFFFDVSSFSVINDFFDTLSLKQHMQRLTDDQPRSIFTISNAANLRNIYIVLRIDKTFQANSLENVYKTYGTGKKNTILTRDSHSNSNTLNTLKLKTIEDDFTGLKQFRQPFLFGFAPIIDHSEADSLSPHAENLIAIKHLLPVDLIDKPGELYNIIQQFGPQCSFMTKTLEPKSVEYFKHLGETLDDVHNATQKKQLVKKLRPIPGYFVLQTSRFNIKQFQSEPRERVVVLGSEADYKTNQNKTIMSSLQETLEDLLNQNERYAKEPSTKELQAVENKANQHLEYQKTEFLDAMPRTPYFTFEHSLYLYPLQLNLDKIKPLDQPKLKPNNLLVEIILKETCNKNHTRESLGVPRIIQQDTLVHKVLCSVTFEESNVTFHDEIKIRLPLPIKPSHHLLFNFYHLVADKSVIKRRKVLVNVVKKEGVISTEDEFPDTVQRIAVGHGILYLSECTDPQDHIHDLPVYKKLTDHYLDDMNNQNDSDQENAPMPAYDLKRNLFKIRTKLISTIYPKEPALSRFFTDCSPFLNVIQKERSHTIKFINHALNAAMEAVVSITKVSFMRLISHYTLVLDMLFSIICRAQDVLHNFVNSQSDMMSMMPMGDSFEELINDSGSSPSSTCSPSADSRNRSGSGMVADSIRASKNRKSTILTSAFSGPTIALPPAIPMEVVQNKRNSRGSIRVDKPPSGLFVSSSSARANNMSPTTHNSNAFKKVKNRLSIKLNKATTPTDDEDRTPPSSGTTPQRIPQPGDADFVLMDYLRQQAATSASGSNSSSTGTTPTNYQSDSTNGNLSSPIDPQLPLAKKSKNRFSLFGPKRTSIITTPPTPVAHPSLKPLNQKNKSLDDQTNSLNSTTDTLSDFLTVSSNIFELQKELFKALVAMLKGAGYVQDTCEPNNRLLMSYVEYIFKDVLMTTSPLCFVLCELWTDMLSRCDESLQITININLDEVQEFSKTRSNSKSPSSSSPIGGNAAPSTNPINRHDSYRRMVNHNKLPVYQESLQFSWFFLDVILKSFAIHHDPNDVQQNKTLQYKLLSLLKELIKSLADKIIKFKDDYVHHNVSKQVNRQVSFFFVDLMNYMEPKHVLDLMECYMHQITKSEFSTNTILLKCDFIHILADSKYYLAMNNSIYHLKSFVRESTCSPPVKMFATMVKEAVLGFPNEPHVHEQCIDALLYILSKHDHDVNLNHDLSMVARLYFPYACMMSQYVTSFESLPDRLLKQYLRAFVWIVGNLNHEWLRDWLSSRISCNDTVVYAGMLKWIAMCSDLFDKNHQKIIVLLQQILTDLIHVGSDLIYSNDSKYHEPSCGDLIGYFNPVDHSAVLSLPSSSSLISNTTTATINNTQNNDGAKSSSSSSPSPNQSSSLITSSSPQPTQQHLSSSLNEHILSNVEEVNTMDDQTFDDDANQVASNQFLLEHVSVCMCKLIISIGQSSAPTTNDQQQPLALIHPQFLSTISQYIESMRDAFIRNPISTYWRWLFASLNKYIPVTNPSTATAPNHHHHQSFAPLIDQMESIYDHQLVTLQKVKQGMNIERDEDADGAAVNAAMELDPITQQVKYATLDQLIERLMKQSLMSDTKFTEVFFLSYRSFSTPQELVSKITTQFESLSQDESTKAEEKKIFVLRFLNTVKMWLTQHPYDFDNALYASVKIFLYNQVGQLQGDVQGCISLANRIKDQLIIDNMLTPQFVQTRSYTFSDEAPAMMVPKWYKHNSDRPLDVLDWEPMEVARQMTLIEHDIFRRIMPKECFKLGWTKSDKHIRSQHIVKLTEQFNQTSSWISTTIVMEENFRRRCNLLRYFIDLAQCLRELNNYNGLNTVISSLNSSSVFRLKKTWKEVPQKKLTTFQELADMVAMTGSFKTLREALLHTEPPCVPYIGVYLTDLVFIEDGNKDMKDGLINFHKRRQIAQIIMNLRTMQQAPYHLREVPYLSKRIKSPSDIWDEEQLYKQSLKIEPRER